MNKLKFIKRTLKEGKKRNVESRDFYDLLIDDNPLLNRFIDSESDLALSFGFYKNPKLNIQIVNEFLKIQKSELETLRSMLFVCAECGDIGCGAITVEIEKKSNSYVWKNFARENDSFELLPSDFIDFPSLEFDKISYENELKKLKNNWLQHQ